MQISQGIAMLELTASIMGKAETIYPTLIWDDHAALLVDTGYPGQSELIRNEIERHSVPFRSLNNIIVTHQDIDHIGSLPSIVQQVSGTIKVMASPFEKPFIEGERRLLRITPEAIEQAMHSIPPDVPEEWRRAFKHSLENPPSSKVNETIDDGDELPIGGGLVVIATPGHTPGHLSLYHKASKTLIAADALTAADGELLGPHQSSLDLPTAKRSLAKLLSYEIDNVVCYHGGLVQGHIAGRLKRLDR